MPAVLGAGGTGPIAPAARDVAARREDQRELAVQIVTLACAGGCADIQAVAHGGRPPYAYRWEDGSTDPIRQLCLPPHAQLQLTATDTPDPSAEFTAHTAQIARANVRAALVDCSAAGAPPPDG